MPLSLKTEDLLQLSKQELLSKLIELARCTNEDLSIILTKSKKETIEFLISRLIGHGVNLDYELLENRLINSQEFLDHLRYTVIKTVAVNLECEITNNVIEIHIIAQDIHIQIPQREIEVNIDEA